MAMPIAEIDRVAWRSRHRSCSSTLVTAAGLIPSRHWPCMMRPCNEILVEVKAMRPRLRRIDKNAYALHLPASCYDLAPRSL